MVRKVFEVEATVLPVAGHKAVFPVRRIYCVGRNYVSHIREMKEADERDPPFFFQKPTDAIVPNGATVPYPQLTKDYQFEVELVAAIGVEGSDIPLSQALSHVFGYAVGFDMTRRDFQRDSFKSGLPWEIGKSFDFSAPCGDIEMVADVGHPDKGEIALSVNGMRKQHGDLQELIWKVPEIIANLSTQYRLMPGDLIMTGTPAGVGPVVPGDEMVGTVAGLRPLRIVVGEQT